MLFVAAAIVLLVYVWTHFHSRRLISVPEARIGIVATITCSQEGVGRKPRMSALGQKQTFATQTVMSALPPIADMCGATRDVRYVPKADIGRMFVCCPLYPKCSDYIRAMGIRDRVNVDGDFGSKTGFTEYGRTSTKNFDVVL